jgi:hypothetical protein
VRCANGWETWVDGRWLVPVTGARQARSRSRGLAIGLAVVALAAGVIGALVLSGGDDDEPSTPVAATDQGIRLNVPSGWAVSADGLTAALREADLGAAVPGGPRVRVLLGGASLDLEALGGSAEQNAPAAQPVGDPERVEIEGRPVAAVTLRETEGATVVMRRYLAGSSPSGVPVLFVLEAPADQFDANAAVMAQVPGWG